MPRPKLGYIGGERRLPPNEFNFDDQLERAAEELSRTLAPSLEEIWMFKYNFESMWLVFTVTRGSLGGEPHTGVVRRDQHPY